ncbi:hypothetical protein E0Z10_g10374 [Xylaria hypoxylon]|uniref:Uncharacterized protein n=1 Tax=Xylaria hypoxylon TaxID=37992 RepID=A0A4Z0YGL4_9PEZI|nr:hypothetical protein E0Z10_g10374 [Xylaria hypoxylon]
MSIVPKDVYTGMWTDWSKDSQVLGSTITVTSSSHIFGFLSYTAFIKLDAASLQGNAVPYIRLIKLYWAYRFTPFAWQQSWLWISISAISAVSGVAAGLFSSQIIDSSLYINVLIDSSNCGFILADRIDQNVIDNPELIALSQDIITLVDLATTYARDCYNSTSDKSQCNFFSSTAIPWETYWDAECPFGNMCIGPAMRLDTGLLNSNLLLGINSPTIDQIGLRKITTCAPILQEGYTEVEPEPPLPGDQRVAYLYGPTNGLNMTWFIGTNTANSTQSYSLIAESYYSGVWADISSWLPIREFNNTHGDGTIFFLSSNSVVFTEPCDDPVFSAHVPRGVTNSSSTVYVEDNLAGVLGCLEQDEFSYARANVWINNIKYQVCSATSSVCSVIGGLGDVYLEVIEKMPLTPMQVGTVDMIAFVLNRIGTIGSVAYGNTPNLVASQSVLNGIQLPLPSNQWQLEIQSWHSAAVSSIKYGLLQYMTGPDDAAFQKYVTAPTSAEQKALCKRQRIRISQGFANISSLGLFFTISSGTAIIILALFLDNIMGCVTRISKGDGKKHRAWIQDDVLHLQRLAYEQQQSFGPRWIATDDNIPLVEGNGFLDPIVDLHGAKIDNTPNRLSVDSLMDDDRIP